MPLLGLALGSYLGQLVGNIANIIGSVILFLIGLNMIRENLITVKTFTFRKAHDELHKTPAVLNYLTLRGFASLMLLCLSVSMDALSVGISLGVFHFFIPLTVGIIGIIAGAMTASGLLLGKKFGDWLGSRAELAGGVILILIGIKLLV
jgi:putative Mn2+ efflux pump MntP